MKHILLVDDSLASLKVANNLLKDSYKVSLAKSGEQALAFCEKHIPDLILLDINMPDINGFEMMELLKSNPKVQDVPVIFVTANNDSSLEARGFESGAVDFIVKPFVKRSMIYRIETHLRMSEYNKTLQGVVHELEDNIVTSFSQLIECRDEETGGHVERTKACVSILAHQLREQGSYKEVLSDEYIKNLVRSAPLHDIGKIGIRDDILLKPGKLTPEEFEIMKKHTTIGGDILTKMIAKMPSQEYLRIGKEIAISHHECYDGTGYPYGISKEDIPLSGRIMAVADVYDAIVSDRVYRKGIPHEEACEIIIGESGTKFDPIIIEAFIKVKDALQQVSQIKQNSIF